MNNTIRALLWLSLACLTITFGATAAGPAESPDPPADASTFQARLEAALKITNFATRDSALGAIASDAADLGLDQIVSQAVQGMMNFASKDEAASTCAARLAAAGQGIAANRVAGMIMNPITRDETFDKLARGTKLDRRAQLADVIVPFPRQPGRHVPGEALLVVVPFFFYLLMLQRALHRCSASNRALPPAMVWLLLIPVFDLMWHFVVVARLAKSLEAEFRARGLAAEPAPGKSLGLALCLISCGICFPFLRVLWPALLVCWVLYWLKIAGYSAQLRSLPAVGVTMAPPGG